jgi:hypothetical protein
LRRPRKTKPRKPQGLRKKPPGKAGANPKRESTVRLLPVDPYLIHAYWEIVGEDLEALRSRLGSAGGQAKPVLRFYDITYILFDGNNAHGFFDVEIDPGARNWYVHLWSPEKSYCADLGLKTPEGRFFPLRRSNVAQTPAAWPSIRQEERYMPVGPIPAAPAEGSTRPFRPFGQELTVASRQPPQERAVEDPKNRAEKMGEEQLSTGKAQGNGETRGQLGRPEKKAASPAENDLSAAVLYPVPDMRTLDLTQLGELRFTGGISSWPSRTEG